MQLKSEPKEASGPAGLMMSFGYCHIPESNNVLHKRTQWFDLHLYFEYGHCLASIVTG